ncbi:cation-translocating P-type ATPase [Ureaplasma sp. OM1]|uniref:Cation-translocating P-type ATPase n=1 Tax=Ureaplasma ceti TaxID=3119530 RepID=A0ABP9UC89_9BACT
MEESSALFGKNKLKEKKKDSLIIKILKQLKEPIIILLLIAAIISLVLAILGVCNALPEKTSTIENVTMFVEPAVILGIVAVNVVFSIKQEGKTEKALDSLKNLSAPTSKVIRDGQTIVIPSENIVVGDILVLDAGDQIAADGVLIEAANLKVEESVLTGESLPVDKDADYVSADNAPLGDKKEWVFSGTTLTNGRALARVRKVGMDTEVGKIAKLLNDEEVALTPLQKQIAKLSKWVGIIAVVVCIITFFVYLWAMTGYKGYDWSNTGESLNVSISLAIAVIPEGLLAVVTVILSISIQAMSKQNALIKRLPAVETLGSTSIICTDKTGTLTQNKMTIVKVWDVNHDDQLSDNFKDYEQLIKMGSLCNDTAISRESGKTEFIGDPTETSIVKCMYDQGWSYELLNSEYPRLNEIPFDSDRKMMTVIVRSDNPDYKYLIVIKGAPDQVFNACAVSSQDKVAIAKELNTEMGGNALRVLAVARKYVNTLPEVISPETIEKDLELVGLLGIIDPPRAEAKVAVAECKQAGIRTIMITGDHKNTASAIAKELGILEEGQLALSGSELDQMSDEELIANIEKYSVYARVSPNDKIRIVKAWKAKGKIVSMTGDGVNDAPSLKAADIGCAMGITGTDVAKNAASMILMDDNFSTIVKAIKTGREIMLNIKSSLVMILTANISNLIAFFIGMLVFIINPLNSLQLLWINVVSETLLGLAIAKNKRREKVMEFKPRLKDQFILDKHMMFKVLFFSCIVAAMALVAFFLGAGATTGFNYHEMIADPNFWKVLSPQGINIPAFSGSGLCFLTIGITLSLNGLCARTNGSIFTQSWADTKDMFLATCGSLSLIFLVAYVPKVNEVFNMDLYNMGAYSWFNVLPYIFGLVFIGSYELYKVIFHALYLDDGSKKGKVSSTKIISGITNNNSIKGITTNHEQTN